MTYQDAYTEGFCKTAEMMKTTKTRRTKMTYQDAYTEGFCKTAEAYGVDPRELVKVAGLWDSVAKYGSRYLELLKGGNKRLLKNWNSAMDIAKKIKDPRLAHDMVWHLNGAEPGVYKRYFTKMPDGSRKLLFDTSKILKPKVVSELNKVFGTRVATGVGALGGAGLTYGAYKNLSKED